MYSVISMFEKLVVHNSPDVNLVRDNEYTKFGQINDNVNTKFGQILSIRSHDIM